MNPRPVNVAPALVFAHPRERADLATFLGRAGRIEDGAVRVQEAPGAVAFWVPVLRPATLIDRSPLILGVRGIPARIEGADDADRNSGRFDAVMPLRGFLDRFARMSEDALRLQLPPDRMHEAWAGVHPPLSGWQTVGTFDGSTLRRIAEAGIAEVAAGTSSGMLGQLRAEQVRTEVWTRELPAPAPISAAAQNSAAAPGPAGAPEPPETRSTAKTPLNTNTTAPAACPPAGAAFALHALGFLAAEQPETVTLHEAPGWWRLAARRGQVLIRRR